MWHTRGTCAISLHSKMFFHHVIGSTAMFSSCWCGACSWWCFILASMKLFFSFFSLFSPKNYNLVLLVVSSSTSIFIFNFWSRLFYRSFICFQFDSSILIYQILFSPMWSLFFEFLIVFLGIFKKVLVIFNIIV